MSIKQFNVTYFINDDRIIFRFNTIDHSEYRFWLTRRLTHFILMSTGKFIEKEYQKRALQMPAILMGQLLSVGQSPHRPLFQYHRARQKPPQAFL